MNQCCPIVNLILRNRLQWNFNLNTKLFVHKNAPENVFYEISVMLAWGGELIRSIWSKCTPFLAWSLWSNYTLGEIENDNMSRGRKGACYIPCDNLLATRLNLPINIFQPVLFDGKYILSRKYHPISSPQWTGHHLHWQKLMRQHQWQCSAEWGLVRSGHVLWRRWLVYPRPACLVSCLHQ